MLPAMVTRAGYRYWPTLGSRRATLGTGGWRRANSSARVAPVGPDRRRCPEPGQGLGPGEAAHVDLGQAPAGSGDGRVQAGQRLVGGDGHRADGPVGLAAARSVSEGGGAF
jgi:hypothetical protein